MSIKKQIDKIITEEFYTVQQKYLTTLERLKFFEAYLETFELLKNTYLCREQEIYKLLDKLEGLKSNKEDLEYLDKAIDFIRKELDKLIEKRASYAKIEQEIKLLLK